LSTVVSNEAQLAQFAYLVNEEGWYPGKTITLVSNLNLSAHYWTPIGDRDRYLQVTFDGGSNTIRGVIIDQPDTDYQGLFGYVYGGSIHDLNLLDVDISGAKGALVNIIGGPNMSLDECKEIIKTVSDKLSLQAKLIWGAKIAPDMDKSIRVLLIVTGVNSSQVLGGGETIESLKHREIEEELGIEFID